MQVVFKVDDHLPGNHYRETFPGYIPSRIDGGVLICTGTAGAVSFCSFCYGNIGTGAGPAESEKVLAISRAFYRVLRNSMAQSGDTERPRNVEITVTGIQREDARLLIGMLRQQHYKARLTLASGEQQPGAVTLLFEKKDQLHVMTMQLYTLLLFLASIKIPHQVRHEIVLQEVLSGKSSYILDLGCGTGALIASIVSNNKNNFLRIKAIEGVELSPQECKTAEESLRSLAAGYRISVMNKDLTTYRPERPLKYDIITMIEVIEHLQKGEIDALEETVFNALAPRQVLITTPNSDYNLFYPGILPNGMRHEDHVFEWDRPAFIAWATRIKERYGYDFEYFSIGFTAPNGASISHMLVFNRLTVPAQAQ